MYGFRIKHTFWKRPVIWSARVDTHCSKSPTAVDEHCIISSSVNPREESLHLYLGTSPLVVWNSARGYIIPHNDVTGDFVAFDKESETVIYD